MSDTFNGFLSAHRLAAPWGQGLKPELLELLERSERLRYRGVEPLDVPQASSGPAHQRTSRDTLDEHQKEQVIELFPECPAQRKTS